MSLAKKSSSSENAALKIRSEKEEDINQVANVISSAFKNHPHSNQKEHYLVADMRKQSALAVSLVAEIDEKIVGHIAFSEVTIDDKKCYWYGLAPVAVLPEYQNNGIGSKLILEGLDRIKKLGAKGCVLLGEPDYYGRFGFQQYPELHLEGVPPEYFLGLAFQDEIPSGAVDYHPLFKAYG